MAKIGELFDKSVTCPSCKQKFTTKKVRVSRLRVRERDTDFLNHYTNDEYPLKYIVFVCPFCGYAAYENKYLGITENQIKIIKKDISLKWVERDFGGIRSLPEAIETQKLALLQGSILKYNKLELGNICLNIGWLYRIMKNKDEEMRFLTLSRNSFIESYNKESLSGTNMDESKLSYLIGELSRRIGEKEVALTWFNLCLGLASTNMNPSLSKMVREQWRLVREK